MELEVGKVVKLKRKSTSTNSATVVFRTIKSIDYGQKKVACDDNIDYKFENILNNDK